MLKEYRQLLKHKEPITGTERKKEEEKEKEEEEEEIKAPPLEKECPKNAKRIDLVPPEKITVGTMPLIEAINQRRSCRKYEKEPLTIEELSFLLWITQGVKDVSPNRIYTKRTVPSGKGRHPFETYLIVNNVKGLEEGIYRYLALDHQLCYKEKGKKEQKKRIQEIVYGQEFVGTSAVVFAWSVIPERIEWCYNVWTHKTILQDSGHICQNLYLGCEAIGAGTCAMTVYNQKKIDQFLELDGEEEFIIYMAPVGKIK
jgi:SagB-type dehydrogenase family enzyme